MRAQPGHLAHAGLNLKQTAQVRRELSKAQRYNETMKRAQPVRLDWAEREERKGEGK